MNTELTDYLASHKISKAQTECSNALINSNVDLYKIIVRAHEMTLEDAGRKRKNYKQRNFMAESMYGNMIGLLYDNYPTVMFEDRTGCHYLRLAKNIRVFPKKLNEKYLPNNIVTKSVKEKRGQELLLNDEQVHVLYAGYCLENEINWMKLEGIYASYVNKYYPTNTEWALDLKDYSKDDSIIIGGSDINMDEEELVRVPAVGIKEAKK